MACCKGQLSPEIWSPRGAFPVWACLGSVPGPRREQEGSEQLDCVPGAHAALGGPSPCLPALRLALFTQAATLFVGGVRWKGSHSPGVIGLAQSAQLSLQGGRHAATHTDRPRPGPALCSAGSLSVWPTLASAVLMVVVKHWGVALWVAVGRGLAWPRKCSLHLLGHCQRGRATGSDPQARGQCPQGRLFRLSVSQSGANLYTRPPHSTATTVCCFGGGPPQGGQPRVWRLPGP